VYWITELILCKYLSSYSFGNFKTALPPSNQKDNSISVHAPLRFISIHSFVKEQTQISFIFFIFSLIAHDKLPSFIHNFFFYFRDFIAQGCWKERRSVVYRDQLFWANICPILWAYNAICCIFWILFHKNETEGSWEEFNSK
jgi:hypothetical protein